LQEPPSQKRDFSEAELKGELCICILLYVTGIKTWHMESKGRMSEA